MTQQQPELVDLYRASLKGAVDLMKASLEGAERLQNQQLIAIRSALDAHLKSASDLDQAKTMDELLAVQTRLAGEQVERMVSFWSSLYENQMNALGQVQSQMEQARQWFSEVAAQTQASAREAEKATTAARQSASEPEKAKTMDELLAVQTRMAGAQVERAVNFWNSLYENQMKWFSEAAAQAQASVRQAEEAARAVHR